MLLVVLAYATAHGSALRKGVAHTESHHCILAGGTFGQLAEPLTHNAESVAIVEVIAVEYGERLVDYVLTHKHCVVGSPWFCATLRACEALRKSVDALEYEFAGDVSLIL